MAPLLEEEENYIRFALLLKGVSPRAVRIFFDKEFSPTYLPSTLNRNYNTLSDLLKKKILNHAQWNLLFPTNSVPDSKTFDITLMICLIRNLTSVIPTKQNIDRLPLTGDTTPSSDLARIKWYRNKLAHHDSNTMSTSDFNTAWSHVADAVSRLGDVSLNQECQELRVKILDQSNHEIMLEIKQCHEEMKELRQKMDTEHSTMKENLRDLQDSHCTSQVEYSKVTEILKDPMPWNIRGQINEELHRWKEDDQSFIETNGAKIVLQFVKENGCVVVTASSGCGKTSVMRHVAIQMQNEGYDILPVLNPKEIIKWYNPSTKILFVVDDFCGTYTSNQTKIDKWKNLMEKIKALVEKKTVKLILACRLQVYNDEQMKTLSFFQSCECNLLSADLRLSKSEKKSIAEFYLKSNVSKINEFHDMFDCFPLLCRLYSKNPKLNIVNFFTNPFSVYKGELDKLRTEAHGKYCALALCVMFNNRLKEEWLKEDVDRNIKKIIKNTYEACKVFAGTSRLVLRDELDTLTNTFIRKDGEVYRTVHDKLFDFLAFYFGTEMIYCLINNATSRFVCERLLFERKNNSDEFTVIIPDRYKKLFLKRLTDDWSGEYVGYVLSNINMVNKTFRRKLLLHIKELDISQQKQLAHSYDKYDKSSPLIMCCFIGDIDLVNWCLYHCTSDINYFGKFGGITSLYMACCGGHPEVVKILLTNNAEIDKCTDTGESPLLIACEGGHTEVVNMLINNKVDINKCNDSGLSPLYIACQNGCDEIVQLLIANKADINKCKDNGMSPLYIACQNGRIEIVQMLIDNKADVNKCNNEGISPLLIACQQGHTEEVKILLHNKAHINKCSDSKLSPFFIACESGHTKIVQMLINNQADINQFVGTGTSPLFMACQNGHTKVVEILVNNNADINNCCEIGVSPMYSARQEGRSERVKIVIKNKADITTCRYMKVPPLFIACQEGHTEIVKILINNNADIDKFYDEELSSLCIACKGGHTAVVTMLIKNKVGINNCNNKGVSPLFIACEAGHTDVVQVLINNNADINKCKDREVSPLFIACQGGHTEVVKMLIDNKADINKCRDTGVSPLCVACQVGHTDVVQLLMKNKTAIMNNINIEVSPLYIACQEGHIELVKRLVNKKADINKCTAQSFSPLHIACQNGHTEVVKILINNEADINKCNNTGASPLYSACQNKHTAVVKILINNKAKINKYDDKEISPLCIACESGYIEIVTMLLNNNADINKCTDKEFSPLFVACAGGHTEVVQMLINNNADINKCNEIEESPLYVACALGHIEVVQMLINNYADINKCTNKGASPLCVASQQRHVEVVKMLIDNQVDIIRCIILQP